MCAGAALAEAALHRAHRQDAPTHFCLLSRIEPGRCRNMLAKRKEPTSHPPMMSCTDADTSLPEGTMAQSQEEAETLGRWLCKALFGIWVQRPTQGSGMCPQRRDFLHIFGVQGILKVGAGMREQPPGTEAPKGRQWELVSREPCSQPGARNIIPTRHAKSRPWLHRAAEQTSRPVHERKWPGGKVESFSSRGFSLLY